MVRGWAAAEEAAGEGRKDAGFACSAGRAKTPVNPPPERASFDPESRWCRLGRRARGTSARWNGDAEASPGTGESTGLRRVPESPLCVQVNRSEDRWPRCRIPPRRWRPGIFVSCVWFYLFYFSHSAEMLDPAGLLSERACSRRKSPHQVVASASAAEFPQYRLRRDSRR